MHACDNVDTMFTFVFLSCPVMLCYVTQCDAM